MTRAIAIARFILAPALVLLAAWFVALRRARPDLITPWLALSVGALLLAIGIAALASALGSPSIALAGIGAADAVAWFLAARLWIERRPKPLTAEGAAAEARRLADDALDLTAVAEREARKERRGDGR